MLRNVSFPLLPGYNFNCNMGNTKFHKSQLFEYYQDIPMTTEKIKTGIGGMPLPGLELPTTPSVYTRSAENKFPAWIVFDKQVLSFVAYFQSTVQEMKDCAYQIRKCKIFFYLEDGTIQVIEPKERNSGIPQGTLIHRQRIRLPPPQDDIFYDIINFNIGREVELYGRVFKIIDCDRFTRVFLNRLGIPVPDPIHCPEDPYMKLREKEKYQLQALKPSRTFPTLAQFLAHDRQVLRFWGYWDDRHNPFGLLHRLRIQYYLADDTIDIKEEADASQGQEMGPVFLRRSKLPKRFTTIGRPGDDFGNPLTVLNVLGTSFQKGHYIYDSLLSGRMGSGYEYVTEKDLSIGTALDVYGRNVVLTSCDPFTQEYYRNKYGRDDYTPTTDLYQLEEEKCKEEEKISSKIELPPYNGYGSFEDSAQNCRSFILKPMKTDFGKFLLKDRQGLESNVLRFEARMISSIPSNEDRRFLINYYLSDDTISIFEKASINSGYFSGKFLKRDKVAKPGQEIFSNKPPEYYLATDLYVGAVVIMNDFHFLITNADEYALSYMEKNFNEFSRSNINLILDKLKVALQPIYKDFVGKYICIDPDQTGKISYNVFWRSIKDVMGDKITDQEILTMARSFPAEILCSDINLEQLRPLIHTELHRHIFHGFERMTEDLLIRDMFRTGWLPRKEIWASCRASKIPLPPEILDLVIDKLERNPNDPCLYSYNHLLRFLDPKLAPPPTVPLLTPEETAEIMRGYGACKVRKKDGVNYAELLKCLHLEEALLQQNK